MTILEDDYVQCEVCHGETHRDDLAEWSSSGREWCRWCWADFDRRAPDRPRSKDL